MTICRIEQVVTSGTFSLDGNTWEVDNNVWILGNDDEVIVIDAAHDAEAIATAVGGRRVRAIVCTHGHNDHIDAAPDLAAKTGSPILIHLDDHLLWSLTHTNRTPDGYLTDLRRLTIADTELTVLHTPGHTPGAICLHAPSTISPPAIRSGRTKDQIVPISDEELRDLPLPTAKAIEIVAFMPQESIDPLRFARHLSVGGKVVAVGNAEGPGTTSIRNKKIRSAISAMLKTMTSPRGNKTPETTSHPTLISEGPRPANSITST